ncbi:DUF1800 domain-containing protein [Nocardioides sp.]|uniref:DUF1800 domain-containing protein n=1 Tax=Nocardioides sp. TaxID=35761 RepID=UPI002D800A7D|nr:DUF1800 domain-containing protein [Nocardioides sp.]HET8959210.1 DUF1800 domain-containing protein [Nocardioides sp.]
MTIPLLGTQARHLVSRFSYGVTPRLATEVRGAGGASAWFERQLTPSAVDDPGVAGLATWFPSLDSSAATLWRRQVEGIEGGWEVMADYARWVLLRRMRSRRQVHEVMTEFWENHFNVPANGDAAFTHRKSYGDAIRAHALDSFEALLQATITHPAMLIYLDNAVSTASHPNENLGRELLELHTVGRGNHDEDDVKSSARILTGWTVDMWRSWAPSYDAARHWRGPVQVLGFGDPNADADGRDLTRRYLSHLAHHPQTARRIARKLAVKFVQDDPPEALVEELADVYLRAGTRIRPVLRALVASPVFAACVGAKVRDPGEDLVATYRALGVRVAEPTTEQDAANSMLWQVSSLGSAPFSWPRPDGQPADNQAWSSPSRVLASMQIHYTMSGTWWPTTGITYRRPTSWAPELPVRFDRLVDHLARVFLHRRASDALLAACCDAVGCRPGERITRDHPVMGWRNPRLLTCVLDSPDFFSR